VRDPDAESPILVRSSCVSACRSDPTHAPLAGLASGRLRETEQDLLARHYRAPAWPRVDLHQAASNFPQG
jgi:hypothetical protein